ncbi:MAG: DUF2157 domain-containing protein [Alphaproteobacteria bacterium]|nr:DUF2157 domain-containing protein [Alphaproteobacteria bacterium]MDY4690080.1 DUF2157 domain-containing protein [Alphaproteobacteria bacterium]
MEKISTQTPEKLHDENYWLMILAYFAAFLIGLGIIALVAANWEQIPNNVKLGGAIVLMIANASAVILSMKFKKNILTQVLCGVFAALIMAVIGLIGQIFQLRSDVSGACLLWALCAWPLFLITPRLLWLWIPLLFVGTKSFAIYNTFVGDVLLNIGWKYTLANGICSLLVFYGLIFAYELWMLYAKPNSKTVERPLRFYCGTLLLSAAPLSCRPLFTNVAFAQIPWSTIALSSYGYILAAMLIYALNRKHGRVSFMPYFLLGFLIEGVLLKLDILHDNVESVLALTSLLLMWGYAYYHKMPRFRYLILFAMLVWFFATFSWDVFNLIPSLLICAALAVYAYLNNSRRLFNVAVLAAVIRLLYYYADASNLTYLGIYLIGSGLLLLATIFALVKYGKLLWEKKHD